MTAKADQLDSSMIRHLILKAKLEGGQISDIGRNVVYMAVQEGLLTTAPELAYEHPLAEKITAVIWEVIIEGSIRRVQRCRHPTYPSFQLRSMGGSASRLGNSRPTILTITSEG